MVVVSAETRAALRSRHQPRGIEADLIDGAHMGTAIELIHLACDATVIGL